MTLILTVHKFSCLRLKCQIWYIYQRLDCSGLFQDVDVFTTYTNKYSHSVISKYDNKSSHKWNVHFHCFFDVDDYNYTQKSFL
jgi:hypothetical protein